MKKQTISKLLVVFAVMVVLSVTMSLSVFATTSASAYVSSDTAVSRGEEITFSVGISNGTAVQSILIIPTYDSAAFELVSGAWMLSGGMLSEFSVSTGDAVILFNPGISVNGTVLTFTLRANDNAAFGTQSVSAEIVITDSNGNSTLTTSPATVQVKCNHSFTKEDTTYLKSEAMCTSPALYYKSCVTCGAKGTDTFAHGSPKTHAYTRQVTTDAYKKSGATCNAKAVYYFCCETCTAKGTTTYEHGSTLAHNYTRKVVTDAYKKSAASCTDAAVYYYCCATCDAKGTTTYTNGSKLGHTGGTATCTAKAECTRCSQEYGNMLDHTYNQTVESDTYFKENATCEHGKLYYKSCTCGAKGSITFEVGEKKAHAYTEKADDLYLKSKATCTAKAVYYKSCSVCGEKGTATFEAGAAPSHSYRTTWSSDSTSHWHECSKCGDKKDSASHTAGAAATEYAAQTCTACGYVMTPALGHTHHYNTAWSKDANNHWYACSGCSTPKNKAAHDYTNACDTDCNTCGYTREITHAYKTEWSSNSEKHWYECTVCGDKKNEAAHTPGADATETTDQTCTVCGYVIKKALGHTHNYSTVKSDETNHWSECACGDKTDVAVHAWDDGVVSKEATYDEEGELTYTCSACARTKTERIAKLVPAEPDTGNEPTPNIPSDGDVDTDDGNEAEGDNNTTVIVIVVAAVVIIAIICVAVILLKKRKA